jgi:hypothetical protein
MPLTMVAVRLLAKKKKSGVRKDFWYPWLELGDLTNRFLHGDPCC